MSTAYFPAHRLRIYINLEVRSDLETLISNYLVRHKWNTGHYNLTILYKSIIYIFDLEPENWQDQNELSI